MGVITDALGLTSSDAEDTHQKNFGNLAGKFEQYRQENRPARQQSLATQMQSYGPLNDLLTSQYGPSARFDLSQFSQSPYDNPTSRAESEAKLKALQEMLQSLEAKPQTRYSKEAKKIAPGGPAFGTAWGTSPSANSRMPWEK